jgi:hypothetical protein
MKDRDKGARGKGGERERGREGEREQDRESKPHFIMFAKDSSVLHCSLL